MRLFSKRDVASLQLAAESLACISGLFLLAGEFSIMLQAAEYFKKISEILILCVELDGARELAELGNKFFAKFCNF